LGVPVLSILERGKLVQKKLLQDAEILAEPTAEELAKKADELLSDPARRLAMSLAGIELMGGPGALASVVEYAARELGWDARCRLYETMTGEWLATEKSEKGGAWEWKMPAQMASKIMKLVKTMKSK
jgi:tetraacyldisaccharide 4'-kinase